MLPDCFPAPKSIFEWIKLIEESIEKYRAAHGRPPLKLFISAPLLVYLKDVGGAEDLDDRIYIPDLQVEIHPYYLTDRKGFFLSGDDYGLEVDS